MTQTEQDVIRANQMHIAAMLARPYSQAEADRTWAALEAAGRRLFNELCPQEDEI